MEKKDEKITPRAELRVQHGGGRPKITVGFCRSRLCAYFFFRAQHADCSSVKTLTQIQTDLHDFWWNTALAGAL